MFYFRKRWISGDQSRRAQRHHHKGPGHQAPKSGQHGCHHHEFETTALDPGAAQRVAHDDEGRGERRNGPRSHRPRQRVKNRRMWWPV